MNKTSEGTESAQRLQEAFEREQDALATMNALAAERAELLNVAQQIADGFKAYEELRGGINDEYKDPISRKLRDNAVTVRVKLLRELVRVVDRCTAAAGGTNLFGFPVVVDPSMPAGVVKFVSARGGPAAIMHLPSDDSEGGLA